MAKNSKKSTRSACFWNGDTFSAEIGKCNSVDDLKALRKAIKGDWQFELQKATKKVAKVSLLVEEAKDDPEELEFWEEVLETAQEVLDYLTEPEDEEEFFWIGKMLESIRKKTLSLLDED